LALFDQIRQVCVFHLVERGKALQELQGAVDVLQHGGFSRLRESISFTHNSDRSFLSLSFFMVGPRALGAHWT